jgi:hypothetical protein
MAYPKERRARIVTSQQDRDDRARTFSQAPQAVRSARGRRGNRISPSTACASRTLHADKCNALGPTADVHSLGNVSGAAAARAVFRIHSSPSVVKEFFTESRSQRQKLHSVTKHEQVRIRGTRRKADFPPRTGSFAEGQHRPVCCDGFTSSALR